MNPPRTEIGGAGWPQWFAWIAQNLRRSIRLSRVIDTGLAAGESQIASFSVTGAPSDAIVLASPTVDLPDGVVVTAWCESGQARVKLYNASVAAVSVDDVTFNIEVR